MKGGVSMSRYDGPSYLNNDEPKFRPIKEDPKDNKVAKYELPRSVKTREDLQKEADRYMETPSYMNRRFRRTQVPRSLQKLDGWKLKRRNEALIETIRQRLAKDSSDYLLFEEFMVEEVEVEVNSKPISDSKSVSDPKPVEETKDHVNLVRKDLAKLNLNQQTPAIPNEKAKNALRKKVVRSKQTKGPKKIKPNTGLKRSLSNIIADDKKAMEHWNSNLDSLFSNEKN